MEKVVRQYELNKPEGTFHDIVELYEWIGKIPVSFDKFAIKVSIVETKEV